jgi:hypothetical protein
MIKVHYHSSFTDSVEDTFKNAHELIKGRKNRQKVARFHRIILASAVVMTCLGAVIKNQAVTYAGIISTVSMLAYMFFSSTSSSLKLANLADKVQSSTEFLEQIASASRESHSPFLNDTDPQFDSVF